jgi:hypothetical protein
MSLSSVNLDVSKFIDFTAGIDYTRISWKDLLSEMADQIPKICPEWTDYSPSDFGIVILQLLAGALDKISYRVDLAMNENSLETAVLRESIYRLAKLIDYTPSPSVSASVDLTFVASGGVTIPQGTKVSTLGSATTSAITFETLEELVITGPAPYLGIVSAIQGETINEVIGSSKGTSHQTFNLSRSPVTYNSIGESSLILIVIDGGVLEIWTEVETILDYGPTDKVFEVDINSEGSLTIIFGDNRNGKIPVQGTNNIQAEYRIGVGILGNVPASTIKSLVTSLPLVVGVTNGAAASGGADAESLEDIKRNAPRSLRTVWRAVTAEDYKTLAESKVGVAKAYAVCGIITLASEYLPVLLYIAPTGGGLPSSELKEELTEFFAERQMLCSETTVLDPDYVTVNVNILVTAQPHYLNSDVKTRVTTKITDYFSFDNVDFGYDIWLSDFLSQLESLIGVDHTDVIQLYRGDEVVGFGNVSVDSKEIPQLGTLTVNVVGGVE